ncbi:ABC transporter substrate-binding protein [Thermodesulfobacteriota bacterium]
MKKQSFIVLLLAVFLFLYSATTTTAGNTNVSEEKPWGTLIFSPNTGEFGNKKGLDPSTSYGGGHEATWGTLIFEGLVTKNAMGHYEPCLAKSWKTGPNWSYVDFTLQEGIKFHNGEPFTAEDVKFSIERYLRKDMMWVHAGELERNLDRVEILDDYHVRIHFKNPFPAFFHISALFLYMLPKDYIENVGDDVFAEKPVGSGPFKLINFKFEQLINLEAVENHWRKTPYVKYYRHIIAEDHSTRLAMLKSGELNVAMIAHEQIGQVKKDPKLRLELIKDCYVRSIQFVDAAYDEPSVWKDSRVRKAASLAIDRKSIIEHTIFGSGTPTASFLPSYCLGYDPSIKPDPFDPERARELLKEAGYPNGFDTVLVFYTGVKNLFEAIAANWNAVGIRAKLEVLEVGEWTSRLTSQKERGVVLYTPEPWWSGGIQKQEHC